jgi:hypothetical protein
LEGVAMKSSALFPFVVLMAVAGSGQAAEIPTPGDPSGPPVSHFQGTCDSDPDGTKFAGRACYTSYDTAHIGHGAQYQPPVCAGSVSQSQRDMLARVYKRAPDYVKGKLCRLTQLFVTAPTSLAPWGWGFWEGPDRPPGKGVYVAISSQDLDGKKSIADAENETAGRLLSTRGAKGLLPLKMAGPPDPELPVLGELAHELAHALLADANADGTDGRHPRRRIVGPPRNDCFEHAFLESSWDPDTFHRHMTRWVNFGQQNFNKHKNANVRFDLDGLRAGVRKGNLGAANDAIKKVYRSREFVSFAGAIRPEEDVVEVYKTKVLVDAAPNQKLSFTLNGEEINVSDLLGSGILATKLQCLGALGFLTGQP